MVERASLLEGDDYRTASGSTYGKKQPSFVSGYIDGQPLYTSVSVLLQDLISIARRISTTSK